LTRLALLSDLHANRHALEAAWADLERQSPDAVYCLGDLVGYGAFPNEVVALVRDHAIPTVMGNYDDGVGFDRDECGCAYRTADERARGDVSLRWTRARTAPENKAFLRSLAPSLRLDLAGRRVLLVHGSPRRMNEYLYEDRPAESFRRLADLAQADVVVFGHTHIPYARLVDGTLFVNAGSVGKPHDGDRRACYAVIEDDEPARVVFRRVEYDVAAAAEAVRSVGLPPEFADILERGWPAAAAGGVS